MQIKKGEMYFFMAINRTMKIGERMVLEILKKEW